MPWRTTITGTPLAVAASIARPMLARLVSIGGSLIGSAPPAMYSFWTSITISARFGMVLVSRSRCVRLSIPVRAHARLSVRCPSLAIALALASSLVWGCADFLGGIYSRRQPLAAVTVISQTAGFVALLAWLAGPGSSSTGARSRSGCWRGSAEAPGSRCSIARSRSAR